MQGAEGAELFSYEVRQFETETVNFSIVDSDDNPVEFVGISGNATAFSTIVPADGGYSVLLEPARDHYGDYVLTLVSVTGGQTSTYDVNVEVQLGDVDLALACRMIPELLSDALPHMYNGTADILLAEPWPVITQQRPVVVDTALLLDPNTIRINVALFDGEEVTLERSYFEYDEGFSKFVWESKTAHGDHLDVDTYVDAAFHTSPVDNSTSGYLDIGGKNYDLKLSTVEGIHVLRDIDRKATMQKIIHVDPILPPTSDPYESQP